MLRISTPRIDCSLVWRLSLYAPTDMPLCYAASCLSSVATAKQGTILLAKRRRSRCVSLGPQERLPGDDLMLWQRVKA
jgi:hypothetical protein